MRLRGDLDELAAINEWLLWRTRGEMLELATAAAFTIESFIWLVLSLLPNFRDWPV